jgi:hypothetical protein
MRDYTIAPTPHGATLNGYRHAWQNSPRRERWQARKSSRLSPMLSRCIAVAGAALYLGTATLACAQRAAPIDSMPAVWWTDTFAYNANAVRGRDANHLLMPLQIRRAGRFEIRMAESLDDGRQWALGALVARQERQDLFDPAIARAPDSSLLVAFEDVDSLTLYRSVDEGRSWTNWHVFHTHGTAEVYWQDLPGRLAMIFAKLAPNQTTTYWVRTTPDAVHWSDPVWVGDGGTIADGFRAGLGPSEGRVVHAVISYRETPTDSVQVRVVSLDAATLHPMAPPLTVARVAPVFKGISVFPVPASCPDGLHVYYSTWVSGPPVGIYEIVIDSLAMTAGRAQPPRAVIQRRNMLTGFGRVWFVRTWDNVPRLVYAENLDQTHTRIVSLPVSDISHCTF